MCACVCCGVQAEAKAIAAREAASTVAMTGNPLLASAAGGSAVVKRRWDDDVVFRNQVRARAGVVVVVMMPARCADRRCRRRAT